MSYYVTDTHALLWHMSRDPQLSTTARAIFRQADRGLAHIFIPSIAVVEVIYLVEKARVPLDTVHRILALLANPMTHYRVIALDLQVAVVLEHIPRTVVPDMPDRIITATAYKLQLPLITRDRRIQQARLVPVVW